jgi:hypothetical protein
VHVVAPLLELELLELELLVEELELLELELLVEELELLELELLELELLLAPLDPVWVTETSVASWLAPPGAALKPKLTDWCEAMAAFHESGVNVT